MAGRVLRSGEGPVSNWNVANLVTFARVAASPLFFVLMMSELSSNGRWLAAAVFVGIIASDAIDGALARGRNLSTPLGVLLDPIADKLVITAALIALSYHGELPWWITVVILVRELGITVYRMVIVSKKIHAASWAGKLKTVTQSVAITLAIAPFSELVGFVAYDINAVVMTAAVVLTVASGADYVIKAWRAR